ncbi:MAG TPA: FHA domain-containing protein [Longimicrobium sp.]|uniref:FHA domain-containing protein n=1 Tax=Longimicrobium sp. TaxID=2029185 RepID=UPI002ED9CA4A
MHENEAVTHCEACGFVRGGGKLVLVAEQTTQRLTIGVDTPVGKHLLQTFAGDDHVYAADPQFLVARNPAGGGWTIAPAQGVKNPTFLNGAALGDAPAPLVAGSVISIGPTRLRLRVESEP